METKKSNKQTTKKSLRKGDIIRIVVKQQGAPLVNHGWLFRTGKDVAALMVDLKSKRCEVDYTFSTSDDLFGGEVGLSIISTKGSESLKPKVKRNTPTIITFPQFKGWEVFAAGIGRYTLRVCLIKRPKID